MNAISSPEASELLDADALTTAGVGPAAVRGAVLRMAAFVGGSLFSVASAAVLFRRLGVVETGRYTTAMSLAALVTGLTDLGLTGVGIRELSVLRGESRARLARNLLGMRLALASVGVLAISAFALVAYGKLLAIGVLIAGFGVLAQNIQAILGVSLVVRMRLGWTSLLEFARQFLTAAVILVLVVVKADLLGFLAATAVAAAITLPPTIALVRGDIPIKPSFDTRQWRALVGPMLTYSVAVITATLYLRIALVLVSLLDSTRQLGFFSVSFRVVENLFSISGLLVGSAFPILAHAALNDPVRLGHVVSRIFEASLIVGVWVSLSLAVGARLAIEVIGGPSFRPAVPVLAVQGVSVAAVFVGAGWAYALLSLHLHRAILILNLSLLALMAGAVALLASLYGAQGAAIASAAVEVLAAIAGGFVLVHGRPHLRPDLSVLPKVALAAAVGASPMLLSEVPVIGRVALSSSLYAIVLAALGAFPSDLRNLLYPGRSGI